MFKIERFYASYTFSPFLQRFIIFLLKNSPGVKFPKTRLIYTSYNENLLQGEIVNITIKIQEIRLARKNAKSFKRCKKALIVLNKRINEAYKMAGM